MHAQNDKCCLGPIGTCDSGPKVAILHAKTTDEAWNPYRLHILVQITMFCMHKRTRGLGPIEICYSGPKVAVLRSQNDR